MTPSAQSFHLHTLGCPKNQVDSDKIAGSLIDEGLTPTDDPSVADLVVVNTCAFIEEAREELKADREALKGREYKDD